MGMLASGGGEIIGGSQREERLDVLDRHMIETILDPAHYDWNATCAATVPCRTPVLASLTHAPFPHHRAVQCA